MNPRIIFMGTSYFSVLSFEKILKYNYTIVGIVTIADKFSARNNNTFIESAVKKYAKLHALPILQSDDLLSSIFLDTLKKWNTEVIIIVAFRILPKVVWGFLQFGNINLHPSILPNYRGASPIQWVIINGETETGISTFIIDEYVDMGKLLLQRKINIKKKENAGCLSIRLSEIGADLIIDTIKVYNCLSTKQQSTNFKFKLAPKLLKFYSKINWKRSIKDIYNMIRGNSPFPGAWSIIANNMFKIYRADYSIKNHFNDIGNIKKNKISLKEGYLLMFECQLAGKTPIIVKDFYTQPHLNKWERLK